MPRFSSAHVADRDGGTASANHVLRLTESVPRGKIQVSASAIATVAGRAAAECYGVVGIAASRTHFGRVMLLPPDQYARGIDVHFADDHITIDANVVLEYGLRITEIAQSSMSSIKYAVERSLGLSVVRVNINVQALRIGGG